MSYTDDISASSLSSGVSEIMCDIESAEITLVKYDQANEVCD